MYIILYADDILLLAPSVTALENLLNDCERELRDVDMLINIKKSFCLRIGPRHDVSCASVVSLSGQMIPWVNEVRYLGIHIVSSRTFRCSLRMAANAVFGKIGGRASEEVIIQIIRTKCMPVLLYGLEACPLRKSDISLIR